MNGIVISFNKLAGVGCIKDINGERIKFYRESFNCSVAPGDLVAYEVALGDRGLIAVNVSLIISNFGKFFRFKSPEKIIA